MGHDQVESVPERCTFSSEQSDPNLKGGKKVIVQVKIGQDIIILLDFS
jgi:hypothetical protein